MSNFEPKTAVGEQVEDLDQDYTERTQRKLVADEYDTTCKSYRYHRYQHLSIRPIEDQDSELDQATPNQGLYHFHSYPIVQPFEVLDHAQRTKEKKTIQDSNFRYFRYPDLSIKPIESDCQEEPNYIKEQQSQIETITFFSSEEIEQAKPIKTKIIRKKKRIKDHRIDLKAQGTGSEYLQKWIYREQKSLPQQCLKILVQSKKEVYQELIGHLKLIIQGKQSKRMLLLTGVNKSGKKTLLFHALSNLKASSNILFKTYFIDLQKNLTISQKQSLERFFSYLILKSNRQPSIADEHQFFVVNSFQQFLYCLKKRSLFNSFKNILTKLTGTTFIFVDRIKTQKNLLRDHIKSIQLGSNNINLIASSLVAYINYSEQTKDQWIINRPLAFYFCSKISQQGSLSFDLIRSLIAFLMLLVHNQEQLYSSSQEKNIVTKDILQRFKQGYLSVTLQVSIDRLNIHQKLALVANYLSLKRHQQVLIPIGELERQYQWGCESLGLQAKKHKQFHREVLGQLETYKLIKVIKKSQKSCGSSVLLNIELQEIKRMLGMDCVLGKFFQQDSQTGE